jgi:hypothetical protein
MHVAADVEYDEIQGTYVSLDARQAVDHLLFFAGINRDAVSAAASRLNLFDQRYVLVAVAPP